LSRFGYLFALAILPAAAWLATGCSSATQQEKFCSQLAQASDPLVATNVSDTAEALRQLLQAAPLEVRDSIRIMLDTFDEFISTPDRQAAQNRLVERASELNDSAAKLESYAARECGLDLGRILLLNDPSTGT